MDGTIAPAAGGDTAAVQDVDRYADDWARYNAGRGVAAGTRLVNPRREGAVVFYDVVSESDCLDASELNRQAARLACGLDLDRAAVLFESVRRRPRLTIIERDPVAEPRFCAAPPAVEDGVIRGVARYIDGFGEVPMRMWDEGGTVPTALVGAVPQDLFAAAHVLACGALATGQMSLFYIDPTGRSSSALRRHARVAILGEENALRATKVLAALVRARDAYAQRVEQDTLLPSAELPGWMVLHGRFSLVVDDAACRRAWEMLLRLAPCLGLWTVAVNKGLRERDWGDEVVRHGFLRQAAIFRLKERTDGLVSRVGYEPRDLPCDDEGMGIQGMALHIGCGRCGVPARWDALPGDGEGTDGEPPLRTSTALAAADRQPQLSALDEQVLTDMFGPAVDGRWVIGGEHATHEFPEQDSGTAAPAGAPAGGSRATTK